MHPAGAEPERIFFIDYLGRRLVLDSVEKSEAPGKFVFMQKLGAGVVLGRAWP
jgi:hypothetical protein